MHSRQSTRTVQALKQFYDVNLEIICVESLKDSVSRR